MNFLISIFAIALTVFFTYNLKELWHKIKSGTITNKWSILATTALIIHFVSIFLYFSFQLTFTVLISEIYMLGCLTYLLRKKN